MRTARSPLKMLEYLAAGKPILCVGPAGSDADNVLQECEAGRALPYADYALMLETLETLAMRWQANSSLDLPGRERARYSRRALTGQLARLVRG